LGLAFHILQATLENCRQDQDDPYYSQQIETHNDTTIVTIPFSDDDRIAAFVCSIVRAVTKIDAKSI